MNVMLADSIDGGIFAILVLLLGGGASVFALIGLVPAWRGNRMGTIMLASPAVIAFITITGWLAYQFFCSGTQDTDSRVTDFLGVWLILAGLPAVTSCAALLVLWYRRKKRWQETAELGQ